MTASRSPRHRDDSGAAAFWDNALRTGLAWFGDPVHVLRDVRQHVATGAVLSQVVRLRASSIPWVPEAWESWVLAAPTVDASAERLLQLVAHGDVPRRLLGIPMEA